MDVGSDQQQMVPELLRGAWRRKWIRHAAGTTDTATIVVWLQLERLMADIRVPGTHQELADRGDLKNCDRPDLQRLLEGESSSGYTTCTPVETDRSGVRTATAAWHGRAGDQDGNRDDSRDGTDGGRGSAVGFQPVTAYPEPGLIEWNTDGTILTERAPSGDYVEEWHLVAGSRDRLEHLVIDERTEIYVAGPVAIRVVDRPVSPTRTARLSELAAGADDRTLRALADCEFSLAEQDPDDGRFLICTSTLPWLIGTEIGVQ